MLLRLERHLLSGFGSGKIDVAILKNARLLAQLVPSNVSVLAMCYLRHLLGFFDFEEAVYAAFILAEDFIVDKKKTLRPLIQKSYQDFDRFSCKLFEFSVLNAEKLFVTKGELEAQREAFKSVDDF